MGGNITDLVNPVQNVP